MAISKRQGSGAVALLCGAMTVGAAMAGDLREIAPAAPGLTSRSYYDPVIHALDLGLTPAMADARVDAAIKAAESCPLVFDTRKPIPHCWEGREQLGS
ncbi:MAG: hypothetical protein H5U24_05255 [Thioclava marina]|jgi:hypothetical protein|nr:hypothetical protein [Thioclava marina]